MTPIEAEEFFGAKYFYRQRIYRLAEAKKITEFKLRGQACYLGQHIISAFIQELHARIKTRFPEIDSSSLEIFYDAVSGKRIVIDGLYGKSVAVNTETETQDDLLSKIQHVIEWFASKPAEIEVIENDVPVNSRPNAELTVYDKQGKEDQILPEEILWLKIDSDNLEGVVVKSQILISLSSVAQFIGVRSDHFVKWLSGTTFAQSVLSTHPKKLNAPQIKGAWKRSILTGLTPFLPFEQLPELIVSFKQSNRTPAYPEKAQLLYELSKSTLESVGLAISGNKAKAAAELAKVGQELGLSAADQIIAVFKQYETREFQIRTNREFSSKVKQVGHNYAATIGSMTLGITGRWPEQWKAYGVSRSLPKKLTGSSREVMRQLSPEDGVGMTFGERHYIKDPDVEEAIKTGKQGKEFYERLKNVGLLDQEDTTVSKSQLKE